MLQDLCHNVVACFLVRILLFSAVCTTSKNHSSVIVGCARVAYYLKVLSCGSCSSLVLACAIHNATLRSSVHVCRKLVSCPAAVSDRSKNVVANAARGEDAFMHQGVATSNSPSFTLLFIATLLPCSSAAVGFGHCSRDTNNMPFSKNVNYIL